MCIRDSYYTSQVGPLVGPLVIESLDSTIHDKWVPWWAPWYSMDSLVNQTANSLHVE